MGSEQSKYVWHERRACAKEGKQGGVECLIMDPLRKHQVNNLFSSLNFQVVCTW